MAASRPRATVSGQEVADILDPAAGTLTWLRYPESRASKLQAPTRALGGAAGSGRGRPAQHSRLSWDREAARHTANDPDEAKSLPTSFPIRWRNRSRRDENVMNF